VHRYTYTADHFYSSNYITALALKYYGTKDRQTINAVDAIDCKFNETTVEQINVIGNNARQCRIRNQLMIIKA